MKPIKRSISEVFKKNIVNKILKQASVKVYAIYIFGSFGTQYQREDSDIDIAIITDTKLSISNRYKMKQILSDSLEMDIDFSIISEYNSSLMMSVLSDGYLIYESDDYNIIFDNIYESLEADFYFIDSYMEELNKHV